ncbi:hypothetical protein K3M35_16890 [Rhodococcus sp. DMU2021]|uniref:hypothetical protein n=1 Tax=Rhodococcus sp. DMU2021 TaxID=2866997 RepID=UPI001C7CB924|nr:hypothetical protein [Rhodococcus sp. DMU2021]MBX4170314.1 hypothetical protein [Rhodococcus sp. DMU2021]
MRTTTDLCVLLVPVVASLSGRKSHMKVISPQAYTALREALPLIAWYKPDFETYLRAAFRSHPALLVGLNFQAATKRELASQVMTRLMSDAPGYQDVTVELMLDIASMERFPYVEKIKDQADREKWLEKAEIAVAELRRHTNGFKQIRQQHEKRDAARAEHAKLIVRIKQFSDDIAQVRAEFMNLHAMTNPQELEVKSRCVV